MNKKKNTTDLFRTSLEKDEVIKLANIFSKNNKSISIKLDNFPKYVRRQTLTRFLALYEIFKKVLNVKGSVIECGVYHGFGLMTWAKLSSILEPLNLTRRVYGFDTFNGFNEITTKDHTTVGDVFKGQFKSNSYEELSELIDIYDSTRPLGHISKVKMIKGDASKTIPTFIKKNQHLLISLLFLDFDLYKPTRVALEEFLPRMPKGAIIAFDELDNPLWPGETIAMLDLFKENKLRIQRSEFDPFIGFAEIE